MCADAHPVSVKPLTSIIRILAFLFPFERTIEVECNGLNTFIRTDNEIEEDIQ